MSAKIILRSYIFFILKDKTLKLAGLSTNLKVLFLEVSNGFSVPGQRQNIKLPHTTKSIAATDHCLFLVDL